VNEGAGLRVGLVGTGGLGSRHLDTVRRLGAEVVAIADVDEERAREQAARTDATAYRDWQDLLANEYLDALFVCTPPMAHARPAVAALDRGVHVFVEKPLARTAADADAIVAAAERAAAVCAVGYQWRAVDFLDDVREHLRGQEISLVVGRSLGPTRARPWFVDPVEGGGIMLELASHDIDLHRALAGEVVAVNAAASEVPLAQTGDDRRRIPNALALTLRFATGAIGVVNVAWTARGTQEVYFVDVAATETTLLLELDPVFRLSGTVRGTPVSASVGRHPSERNIAGFLDSARTGSGAGVFSTPRDAARALTVALACEESLASGRTVEVAP